MIVGRTDIPDEELGDEEATYRTFKVTDHDRIDSVRRVTVVRH